MRYYIRRFIGTLMFFVAIVVLGTVAYQVVEGWSLGDSFYMTVPLARISPVGCRLHICTIASSAGTGVLGDLQAQERRQRLLPDSVKDLTSSGSVVERCQTAPRFPEG